MYRWPVERDLQC